MDVRAPATSATALREGGKINGWQGTVELVLEGTFASTSTGKISHDHGQCEFCVEPRAARSMWRVSAILAITQVIRAEATRVLKL
jgi:hypothetical protein